MPSLTIPSTYLCRSTFLIFSPFTTTTPTFHRPLRRPSTAISASSSPSPSPPDRLLSAASYLFPFLDGIRHGRFLAATVPPVRHLLRPFLPASALLRSSPFISLAIFLSLYLAVVRNPESFSRFVRFNAMQAVVIDVLLIFPDLIERTLDPRGGVGLDLLMSLDSTVFLYLLVCLVYGSGSCLAGRTPRLPLVADAAEQQVM